MPERFVLLTIAATFVSHQTAKWYFNTGTLWEHNLTVLEWSIIVCKIECQQRHLVPCQQMPLLCNSQAGNYDVVLHFGMLD